MTREMFWKIVCEKSMAQIARQEVQVCHSTPLSPPCRPRVRDPTANHGADLLRGARLLLGHAGHFDADERSYHARGWRALEGAAVR